jgi:hypothetical protein
MENEGGTKHEAFTGLWQPRSHRRNAENLGLVSRYLEPPKNVNAVPQFLPDLKVLGALMYGDEPPLKRAHCS